MDVGTTRHLSTQLPQSGFNGIHLCVAGLVQQEVAATPADFTDFIKTAKTGVSSSRVLLLLCHEAFRWSGVCSFVVICKFYYIAVLISLKLIRSVSGCSCS